MLTWWLPGSHVRSSVFKIIYFSFAVYREVQGGERFNATTGLTEPVSHYSERYRH